MPVAEKRRTRRLCGPVGATVWYTDCRRSGSAYFSHEGSSLEGIPAAPGWWAACTYMLLGCGHDSPWSFRRDFRLLCARHTLELAKAIRHTGLLLVPSRPEWDEMASFVWHGDRQIGGLRPWPASFAASISHTAAHARRSGAAFPRTHAKRGAETPRSKSCSASNNGRRRWRVFVPIAPFVMNSGCTGTEVAARLAKGRHSGDRPPAASRGSGVNWIDKKQQTSSGSTCARLRSTSPPDGVCRSCNQPTLF